MILLSAPHEARFTALKLVRSICSVYIPWLLFSGVEHYSLCSLSMADKFFGDRVRANVPNLAIPRPRCSYDLCTIEIVGATRKGARITDGTRIYREGLQFSFDIKESWEH